MQEKLRTSLTLISERLIALLRTSRRAAAAAINQARVRSGLLQRGKVRTALIVTMILLVLLGIIVAPLRAIAAPAKITRNSRLSGSLDSIICSRRRPRWRLSRGHQPRSKHSRRKLIRRLSCRIRCWCSVSPVRPIR